MKILPVVICMCLSLMIFSQVSFADFASPRKQLQDGVAPEEITCNTGLVLVIRPSGMPACVKVDTAEKFQSHGWVSLILDVQKPTRDITIKEIPVPENIQIKEIPISENIQTNKITSSSGTIIQSESNVESQVKVVPAAGGSVVNFYLKDDDLNLAHGGVETVSTAGLLEFTINGISIPGPESMTETGPDTGEFYVKLQLPETINGRAINQNDIVVMKYFDASSGSGDSQTLSKSISLARTPAQVQVPQGGKQIGHDFVVRLYEPDANLDSRDVDRIPLSRFEFRADGGIRVPLTNSAFDANASYMLETGKNTGMFEVTIKIPRQIDGKTVFVGDSYEIRYIDRSTPSNTDEKVIYKGKIGLFQ